MAPELIKRCAPGRSEAGRIWRWGHRGGYPRL